MKRILVLLLLALIYYPVSAATFTVTSNADSGPGSLREAITLANGNGTSQMDYIHFNISATDVVGVTIALTSELPIISSNIVIDATTQPLSFFTNPGIKIGLLNVSATYFSGLRLDNSSGIEIYGLMFTNFKSDPASPVDQKKAGIFLYRSSNVVIGAPNKPNCFVGNYAGILSPFVIPRFDIVQIKISSNIFGLLDNGITPSPNETGIDISFLKNSVIGGDTPEEGNLISGNTRHGIALGGATDNIKVANNVIGLDITMIKVVPANAANGIYVNGESAVPLIANNYICGQKRGVFLDFANGGFVVSGNKIGTGVTGTEKFGNETGIHVNFCNKGLIGGSASSAENKIAYNKTGVLLEIAYPISMLRNSFYCNSIEPVTFKNLPTGKIVTQSRISTITPTGASGTYLPNSTVELFYTDDCPNCEGKTWIATLSTDGAGKWAYNGPINGKITSMGTNVDGATSTFSKPFIENTGQPIGGFCGLNNGSIKGVKLYDWSIIQWYNSSGQVVGSSEELTNVPPGDYYFKAGQLGLCDVTSAVYNIPSLSNGITETGKKITEAYCGNSDGSIKGIVVANNLTRIWYSNATGNIVGTDDDLENVPAGIYHFTAGQGSCLIVSPNYEVPSISQLYVSSNVSITPATCNQANGRIVVSGNGGNASFTFKWFDASNVEVGNTQILNGKGPGKYRLEAYSDRGCSNIVGEFEILEIPLPMIDYSSLQKFISCDGKTISTSGIAIVGSTAPYSYAWLDENNNVVSNQLNISTIAPGKYTLKVTDKNGCAVDGQTIDFLTMENTNLVIPNSFTPNGDGVNDLWQISGAQNYVKADFSIYGRDGNRVFYSRGYSKAFDGTFNGKILPVGVYYYVIDLKTDCGKISGSLTILR